MHYRYFSLVLLFSYHLAIFAQGPSSRTEARIGEAKSQYGLSGEQVLTVIMDRGVDYTHPDFIDANGKTRIAYVYDLYDNSGMNDADNPYGIGTIYDAAEINEALEQDGPRITNDLYGHGTATTGIVCGNGSGADEQTLYQGVANNAKIISIIITKEYVPPFNGNPGQSGSYMGSVLPTAFQFASDKIKELGLPSVTLLNIGSIGQPTDGSIEICEVIDAYSEEGNIFVCGVGDDGGQDNHAIEQLAANTTTTFEVQKGEDGFLRFTAWYDEAASCQVSIKRPEGTVEGPFNPPTSRTDSKSDFLDGINIYHRGADVDFDNSNSDLRQLLVDFSGAKGTYEISLITDTVGEKTTVNAMLNPSRYYNTNKFLNFSIAGGNINGFSSCFSTISPTDYVGNHQYVDINGVPRNISNTGEIGALWLGSSTGNTMDGRLGIDLASPGELAVGAYSKDSYYSTFAFNVFENSNGYYGIQNAVSGAAPIVTGVIALMLEVNPSLTSEEVKAILQETSRTDEYTGSVPNASWGYGKMDAFAAIERTLQTVGIENAYEKQLLKVAPNPFSRTISIQFPDHMGTEARVSIFSQNGQKILETDIKAEQAMDLGHLPDGLYFIQLRNESYTNYSRIVKLE